MMLKIMKSIRFASFRKFGVVTASALALGTIAQAAPIELTMQHMEQPPSRVEAMQVVVDKFNEKYPEYRMKQNVVGWGEAFTRVPAQIEAGVGVRGECEVHFIAWTGSQHIIFMLEDLGYTPLFFYVSAEFFATATKVF